MATVAQPASLGQVVLKCRRRSYAAVHWSLSGLYGAHQLILVPAIVSFFGVGGLCIALDKSVGLESLGLPKLAPIGFMVTALVGMLLWQFVAPDANLVLHENGFVYRRKKILFSQLRGIFIGRNNSAAAELARGLGTLMSWHPASRMIERSTRGSVTLAFDGDKTLVMKNVLWENNWEDVQRFFGHIQEDHPEVHIEK